MHMRSGELKVVFYTLSSMLFCCKLGEDWLVQCRVIDMSAMQNTLTWNGSEPSSSRGLLCGLLCYMFKVGHNLSVLALGEVMWITCRWPSLLQLIIWESAMAAATLLGMPAVW